MAVVLIIDEISMLGPTMLAFIQSRLQDALNFKQDKKPMGGLICVALGGKLREADISITMFRAAPAPPHPLTDFLQIPPVGQPSLYTTLLETLVDGKGNHCQQPGTMAYDGVALFADFTKTEFHRNMRSGEDPIMARRVVQLRDVARRAGCRSQHSQIFVRFLSRTS